MLVAGGDWFVLGQGMAMAFPSWSSPACSLAPATNSSDRLNSRWLMRNSSPCMLMLGGGRSPNLSKTGRSQPISMDAAMFTPGVALLHQIRMPGCARRWVPSVLDK